MARAALSSTSLSTICAKAQLHREHDMDHVTPRIGRPSPVAFHGWLERARAGDQLEYHRGLLTRDRSPASELAEATGARWPRWRMPSPEPPWTAAFTWCSAGTGRSTSATSPSKRA